MQRYIVTFFILIVMTVNQMRTAGRKRKDKDGEELRNQDVVFISFLNKEDIRNQSLKDESSFYADLENFGNIELEGNKVTIVVPVEEIRRRKRKGCRNNCRKHSKTSTTQMQSNHTRRQNTDSSLSLLKPHGNPIVIMKAEKFRKDWCRTERVKHKISEQGCKSKIITNNFCYGQCNSFFIPRQIRGRKDLNNFRSCSFCQPSSSRWISVILHCPQLVPPYRKKRIYRVDKCHCSTKNIT
ncbi:gremlin-2-like [Centruroides sculpturatus]|uniref:gremlin-2-like n=1 Tax=Centruroides sculpturatus TaxID=218467 RepID=UPI000C6DE295|nr:gremlin-2-like [Centruroides sculpturatus]XP_023216653.1 gremlin-2-like [Centruroides sculpturatus]XP_023216654.1 gremlin-2-like [Centruroides sculpturatus]